MYKQKTKIENLDFQPSQTERTPFKMADGVVNRETSGTLYADRKKETKQKRMFNFRENMSAFIHDPSSSHGWAGFHL